MLDLKLAPGFTEAPFSSTEERWVLGGHEIEVADVGLNTFRTLRHGSSWNCPMGFAPGVRVLYLSQGSIQAIQIDSDRKELVMRPPPIPFAEPPPRESSGDDDDYDDEQDNVIPPCFIWYLSLSPDALELVAMARVGDECFLVHKDLTTGTVTNRPLPRFGGFLHLDWASRRLYEGDHDDGPTVSTLEGKRVAVLSALKGNFRSGRLSRGGDRALIWESRDPGLPFLLWDLANGTSRELQAFGGYATWSPDGSGFWFMKGNHEVWRYNLASDSCEPLLTVKGRPWNQGARGMGLIAPVVSPDGRYLYVQLSDASAELQESACVLDLKERKVRQVSERCHENVTWME